MTDKQSNRDSKGLNTFLTHLSCNLTPSLCLKSYADNQQVHLITLDHGMKIYMFNSENGVYLGEDFDDEAKLKQEGYLIPAGATTIAPPEGGRGHKLVFDVVAQCWEVHTSQPTYLDKPLRKEIRHYVSGSYLIFAGIMLWFAALCDDNKYIGSMCGLSIILGASAYMSLKERLQDPAANTRLRKYFELGSILFIFLGYLLELSTTGTNNVIILLNSVTAITSIATYLYFLSTWPKRISVNRHRDSNMNNTISKLPLGPVSSY
jgi:hypothetical protein